jgi:pheromone shutdown protein TraB
LKRSQAVNGKKVVVGVIGAGHVPGVLRACDEDDRRRREGRTPLLRFRDLV